ncbi:MAG: hypothetical protein GWN18_07140 [Thermoplasmata archaeon]|nr:hypothetical protein [Thermoplasmata archaeon]NIS11849.1 hypothetical protein [Thermoplasmata archaeon]NIS19739.1 hypothetical protein [Thermoplasmata archaeon]NIT76928.1 hypothetical protein [Thermoplasmata archaeon]NIU48850.1 hypothetical protein [Thermoplasmata archaeon]
MEVAPLTVLDLDVGGMTAEGAADSLGSLVSGAEPSDTIVLLRVRGALSHGRPTDIGVQGAREALEERGARAVFVNRRGLRSGNPSQ